MAKKPPRRYTGWAPDLEVADTAIHVLQAELNLVAGNLDGIDRKAALLPPFLVLLANLILPDAPYTPGQVNLLNIALVAALLSTICIGAIILPAENALGPNASQVVADLGPPLVRYRTKIALALADSIEHGSHRTVIKSRLFAAAAILAATTIMALIALRVGWFQ